MYGFGWSSVDYTKPPVIPGTVAATVSPTSDSTYNYRIGNVTVRNFPTLANMPATLYVGTQSSFLVSNEVIPGLEISASDPGAINVCKLETQTNGSVNAVLNSRHSPTLTDPQIYLKRGGRVLCSGSIKTTVHVQPKLTVVPETYKADPEKLNQITKVKLYGENNEAVQADELVKGPGIRGVLWIDSESTYQVNIDPMTAGTVSTVVFKKSGYEDATLTVTWGETVEEKDLKVWFKTGSGDFDEVLLDGQSLELLSGVPTTPDQTNGIFRFSFRYENNKGQAWRPVVAGTDGEDMIGVIEGIPGGEGAFTQLTYGEFTVKVIGRTGGDKRTWGILRFETQGTMTIPTSSEIITNIF